jgi:uncharacterized membrane protein YhhN
MPLWIAIAAPLLLIVLLWAIKSDRPRPGVVVKTALSALFVTTALLQPQGAPLYGRFILLGLVLSMGGDVALALSAPAAFRTGLALFLLGHVAYTCAFLTTWSLGTWALAFALAAAASGGVVYHLLRPHLGSFRAPVLAYVVAISLMLVAAAAVLDHPYETATRRLVLLGALLFYLSDLFVARHRFVQAAFANRLVGLSLYYAGQFMLAVSIGLIPGPPN